MGAHASKVSPSSPKNETGHFYDSLIKMKGEKMTDQEIYTALKKKFVHTKSSSILGNRNRLQKVARNHFSQTLETNRIILAEKKKNAELDTFEHNSLERSSSCGKLKLSSHYSYQQQPLVSIHRLPAPSVHHKPLETLNSTAETDSSSDVDEIPTTVEPSQTDGAVPKKRAIRHQLTVVVDSDEEEGKEEGHEESKDKVVIKQPRREADHISPNGAVHVGRFAISERGLSREASTKRIGQVPVPAPHAFLTSGKSDFVEIGFLGAGVTGSVVEALHIPTLTIVALKMLRSSDLQCISSELSVLYQNLAELDLVHNRLDREKVSEEGGEGEGEHTERHALSSPCEQVLTVRQTLCVLLITMTFLDSNNAMVNLVVEYMDGGSLQDLVDKGGCQDELALADITRQGLLGLDFLHSKNCAHRDIKPGNILVNCAGIVKLADFGIAKAMDVENGENTDASFMGTMCYMAPEVMNSTPSSGSAADIWSFGLTLLAVVLGKYPLLKPSEKMDYWNLVKVICDEPHPSIGEQFSDHTQSFINACLYKDPAERACVKKLLSFPFVKDFELSTKTVHSAKNSPSHSCASSERSNASFSVSHKQLSACTVQAKLSGPDAGNLVESADVMLMKFAHLETVLEHVEMKFAIMVELWKEQDSQPSCSYRSISARADSISMQSSAKPMTRLPNFVSGREQWKHLAAQLHMPLDIVMATASKMINPKYFAH